MINLTNSGLVLSAAILSAQMTFVDVDDPQALAPNNYEGDGESFGFDWIELLSSAPGIEESDKDICSAFYLSAFWIEISALQSKDN